MQNVERLNFSEFEKCLRTTVFHLIKSQKSGRECALFIKELDLRPEMKEKFRIEDVEQIQRKMLDLFVNGDCDCPSWPKPSQKMLKELLFSPISSDGSRGVILFDRIAWTETMELIKINIRNSVELIEKIDQNSSEIFLREEVQRDIITENQVRDFFKTGRHPVAKYKIPDRDKKISALCFKQDPELPLVEMAILKLSQRIAGCGIPNAQLVKFKIRENEPFYVLVSEFISGDLFGNTREVRRAQQRNNDLQAIIEGDEEKGDTQKEDETIKPDLHIERASMNTLDFISMSSFSRSFLIALLTSPGKH